MKKSAVRGHIKIEAKRHTELWIYSFADMYMILSVFFIALAVLYAAQVKKQSEQQVQQQKVQPLPVSVPTAGQGATAVESILAVYFARGTAELNDESRESLALMLPILKSSKGQIEIEGYADTGRLPASASFTSNLSLSSSRAVKVAEWMMNNGIAARKIRTFSYGDGSTFHTDPDGNKSNRRVVIKITTPGGSL